MCESNSNSEISSNEEELLEQENPPIKKVNLAIETSREGYSDMTSRLDKHLTVAVA